MNLEHPADYSPLSYGAGLTIGLLLLLGLPAEPKAPRAKPAAPPRQPAATCPELADGNLLPNAELRALH